MSKVSLSNNLEPHGIEALVCADIAKRQNLGMKKYGISVENNPILLKAWLTHTYEEVLDTAVYLRRAIAEIEKNEARRDIEAGG